VESSVELGDSKARALDRVDGVPRRLAPSERPGPEEGVAYVLKRSERATVGANVLPEAEFAVGDQHAAQLSERGDGVGHAAEDTHHHGPVETARLRGQRRRVAVDDLDRYLCGSCPIR
jgi:hypothetical protein